MFLGLSCAWCTVRAFLGNEETREALLKRMNEETDLRAGWNGRPLMGSKESAVGDKGRRKDPEPTEVMWWHQPPSRGQGPHVLLSLTRLWDWAESASGIFRAILDSLFFCEATFVT